MNGVSARRSLAGLFAAVLLVGGSGGCGYGLVGRGGGFDPSIKRIGVPLFKDGTGKVNLDMKITQKVIEELLKRGKVDVVQNIEGVDAIVEGEILSFQETPVGFSGGSTGSTTASRYAITLTVRVRYYKPGEVQPMWQNDAFSYRDEYDLGSDSSSFFDRADQGVDRLAQAFARSLIAAMLEAF
ncbi:MAG TPA: LptE family protein [Vicinamibacteria bacterium]|mgnify:CR=1 FL=1|nr:LptE family protein [Vicinamibacteria bacterium]HRB12740.1 LptE family protein [Vicinamibacteria bacterium]